MFIQKLISAQLESGENQVLLLKDNAGYHYICLRNKTIMSEITIYGIDKNFANQLKLGFSLNNGRRIALRKYSAEPIMQGKVEGELFFV